MGLTRDTISQLGRHIRNEPNRGLGGVLTGSLGVPETPGRDGLLCPTCCLLPHSREMLRESLMFLFEHTPKGLARRTPLDVPLDLACQLRRQHPGHQVRKPILHEVTRMVHGTSPCSVSSRCSSFLAARSRSHASECDIPRCSAICRPFCSPK